MTIVFKSLAFGLALTAVAGCTGVVTRSTEGFTSVREGDTLSGTYDPQGFTELTIKDLLKFDCPTQRLARYSETPGPRTLISFTAVCAA